MKENKIKNDMGAGTPTYPDNIQDLKDEANNKTKLILKLSDEQDNYKNQLSILLTKLNILIVENSDLLLSRVFNSFDILSDSDTHLYIFDFNPL